MREGPRPDLGGGRPSRDLRTSWLPSPRPWIYDSFPLAVPRDDLGGVPRSASDDLLPFFRPDRDPTSASGGDASSGVSVAAWLDGSGSMASTRSNSSCQ